MISLPKFWCIYIVTHIESFTASKFQQYEPWEGVQSDRWLECWEHFDLLYLLNGKNGIEWKLEIVTFQRLIIPAQWTPTSEHIWWMKKGEVRFVSSKGGENLLK